MNENVLRAGLLATARSMASSGLNAGTAGNASVRCARGFLITPWAQSYRGLHRQRHGHWWPWTELAGPYAPSSEWRIHQTSRHATRGRRRAHAHSPFATALACLRRGIPAFHYMIARFGADDICCARTPPSVPRPSPTLPDGTRGHATPACWPTTACSCSALITQQPGLTIEFGNALRTILAACQLGQPTLLSAAEMAGDRTLPNLRDAFKRRQGRPPRPLAPD